jgi:hypothetical protein
MAIQDCCAAGFRRDLRPGTGSLPCPLQTSLVVPSLIADLGDDASWRYVEFFTANIGLAPDGFRALRTTPTSPRPAVAA